MLVSATLACLCNFQLGFNTAIISAAQLYLPRDFPQLRESFNASLLATSILVGALVGALVFSRVSDTIGRRKSIIFINLLYLLFTVSLAVTPNSWFWMLVAVRSLLGLAVGGSSVVVPTYINEIVSPRWWGRMGTLIQFCVTSGIMSSYAVGYAFSFTYYSWRFMFAASSIVSLFVILMNGFILESPRWLTSHDRHMEADDVSQVLGLDPVDAQLIPTTLTSSIPMPSLWLKKYRIPLFIAITINVLQQLSGFNSIVYYSGTIFSQMGYERQDALLASAFSTLPQLLSLVFVARYVDRFGRRPILIGSMGFLALAMFGLGLTMFVDTDARRWLSLSLILMARMSFAAGLGPVPAFLASEILVDRIRSRGMGLASFFNWLANIFVSITFLPLLNMQPRDANSILWQYWIYACVLVCGALWVFGIRETSKQSSANQEVPIYDDEDVALLNDER